MKKALSIMMVIALIMSTFTLSALAGKPEGKGKPGTEEPTIELYTPLPGGMVDLGIANDERLIEMLIKNGKLDANSTIDETNVALKTYLNGKANSVTKESGELIKEEIKIKEMSNDKLDNFSLLQGKGNKKGHTSDSVSNVVEETWDGSMRKDNILAILIDYPDKPHNNIGSEYTDMYYEKYTKEHYEAMLFGENGYKGPKGEDFISMKQYYEEQSGGSYTVNGTVAGWYTASQPAAYYGGNVDAYGNPDEDGSDAAPRSLVYEALLAVAQDPTVDLSQFDKEDRYDLDGDGNFREPDGLIDHLMIIHAGVGEEAGGGSLGGDAIWSHRWNLGGVATIPGTTAEVGYWGGSLAAYDYTIEPEDGAMGVFAHEYGHDLGLPDEYDTQYTGAGEPVSYWSIMSSGSWAGLVGGTEPTGFGPYMKEMLQTSMPGSNWQSGSEIYVDDITSEGIEVLLDQANSKGTNNDVLKINLPNKVNFVNVPYSGDYQYFSGSGNNLDNYMYNSVDLTNATSATLNFKAWYDIETDWDYASVFVQDAQGNYLTVEGNITTTANPYDQNPGYGITGSSNGWVDSTFDLSQFAGQTITVGFNYWTDGYVANPGFYADDIAITVDSSQVVFDNAEGESLFALAGFTKDMGKFESAHYYLIEWRNHEGVDAGLGHIARGNNTVMSFDPGMLVWYVDNAYDNNWTGIHPGEGFVGVVDADQKANIWSNGQSFGSTRYQVHDAAFGLQRTEEMYLDYRYIYGYGNMFMIDNDTQNNPLFDDSSSYMNTVIPDAGKNVPNYGLKIRVIGESEDRSVGKILLFK